MRYHADLGSDRTTKGSSQTMATLQAKSVLRREDEKLLTGRGNYAADGKRDGMLVAVLVHSTHAHARIAGNARDEIP